MGNSPHAPISYASRRRLARCLVGSPLREIEQDLVLETLANTRGNRTESARLLGETRSTSIPRGASIFRAAARVSAS
jgi:DNA-binding NtrC family response regulator